MNQKFFLIAFPKGAGFLAQFSEPLVMTFKATLLHYSYKGCYSPLQSLQL